MSKKAIKILNDYLDHLYSAGDNCNCAICSAQENETYADGLRQAINIIEQN